MYMIDEPSFKKMFAEMWSGIPTAAKAAVAVGVLFSASVMLLAVVLLVKLIQHL